MDKYKTSEMGKALKKVFRNEITVEDSVSLAKQEIEQVFHKKAIPLEQETDNGFYGDIIGICPKCGAEVSGNTTGICQYCNAKIIFNEYDWVMSKKQKISQR